MKTHTRVTYRNQIGAFVVYQAVSASAPLAHALGAIDAFFALLAVSAGASIHFA